LRSPHANDASEQAIEPSPSSIVPGADVAGRTQELLSTWHPS
jgi:hypothetical protein